MPSKRKPRTRQVDKSRNRRMGTLLDMMSNALSCDVASFYTNDKNMTENSMRDVVQGMKDSQEYRQRKAKS